MVSFFQLCVHNYVIYITGIDVDYFGLTVSFHVLERMQSIEKLAKVVRETDFV